MATNDNRSHGKNPVLDEIINDDAPILEDSPDYVKPEEEIPDETPEVDPEVTPDEVTTDPENEPEVTPEPDPAPVVPTVKPTPTPEEQLKEQRTEAQIKDHQYNKITETVEEAANLPEPTMDELKVELQKMAPGTEWDDLSILEQNLFKQNYINNKRFSMVNKVTQSIHEIDKRARTVDTFIETVETTPELKKLVGREAEFRKFAMMESHRGVDLNILAGYFLNKLPTQPAPKASLFPVGGGQAPPAPKSDIITDADEVRQLKLKDPREYARKMKAGKIRIEI